MSTKRAMSLIAMIGWVIPLSAWLTAKAGFGDFILLDIIASLVVLGLLAYAAFREQAHGDKSERVPPKAAVVILCGVGLWVGFCFYRVLAD